MRSFYTIVLTVCLTLHAKHAVFAQFEFDEPVFGEEPSRRILDQSIFYSKWIVTDFLTEDKTWFWYTDIVYRTQSSVGNDNIFENPLRFSIRPFVAYQFGRFTRVHFNPVGLYVSDFRQGQPTDNFGRDEIELRSMLEITQDAYIKKAGKEWVNLTHRWRFESRWRGVDDPIGPLWNFRFRYRTRFRVPLNGKHFYDNNVLYTINYHELHLELGPYMGLNQFAQNRNFVGIGYRFWDWVRIDVGYLHQYNFRGDGVTIDMSRGPMFYLFVDYLSKVRWGGKDNKTRLKQLID
ncbi:MAG: DUF2490 domain-containing protein [Nitritalea sp.]